MAIDDVDQRLIQLLRTDARMPVAKLAVPPAYVAISSTGAVTGVVQTSRHPLPNSVR